MTPAQIAVIIRAIVLVAGSVLVSLGWATPEQVEVAGSLERLTEVAGAAMVVGGFAWAIWSSRKTAQIRSVANLPEVAEIKATPEIARRVDVSNVTETR